MHSQISSLRGQESSEFKMSSPSPTGTRIRDSTMRHCSSTLTFEMDTIFSMRSSSIALGGDNIIPKGRMRRWKDPKPPTPSPTFEPYNGLDDVPLQEPGRSKGKGTHKRTISAAIPSIERVTGR